MKTFYLGIHNPKWLSETSVPLFVSRVRLQNRKTFPRARGAWSLDSGGFSELNLNSRWTISAKVYAEQVQRFSSEIGKMKWAAQQDWMCEPQVLRKTGKTVKEHQRLTVQNFITLRGLSGPHIIPVLQGWEPDDYLRCVDLFEKHGVSLTNEPLVGIGSVCRRQSTTIITSTLQRLFESGIKLHAFGFKFQGLKTAACYIASSDSMAWSFDARYKRVPAMDCPKRDKIKNCANCLHYALDWRKRMLETRGLE